MACPKCGSDTSYTYDTGHDPALRCASCGKVFYPEEAADDEDDYEESDGVGRNTIEVVMQHMDLAEGAKLDVQPLEPA